MSRIIRLLSVVAALSVAVSFGVLTFDFFQVREKFPPQTFIGEVDVSSLDQSRAIEKIKNHSVSQIFAPALTFEADKERFTFSPEDLGVLVDHEHAVSQAFQLTHDEGYLRELRGRLAGGARRLPLVFSVDEDQFTRIAAELAEEIRSTPRDASIVLYEETGGYHIEPEVLGRELDKKATLENFKAGLTAERRRFPLIINYTYPRITEEALREKPPVYRLGAFTTYYGRHDSPNRIYNIKLIASWIDGTLLIPGDEFSLVETIGDFTPERGFKEAFVIYAGVLTPMLGGGACQIGTTLYNAVALADLEILQRQNHSFYFNIYPLGRDATVYPGQKDLRFKNNTGHPILIKAVATNLRLSFRVYGTPTGKKVTFSSPAVLLLTPSGYRPSTVREVLDSDLPFKTTVVRTVHDQNGNKLHEETVNSFYKLYGEKTNVPIARPEPR